MKPINDILSVPQPDGRYKYYRTHRKVDEWGRTGLISPARDQGLHFEQAMPRVPIGSRPVGMGDVPLGSLAQEGDSVMGVVAIAASLAILFYLSSK